MGLHRKILDLLYLRIPLINTRYKKDGTLDSPSILISFSSAGKKGELLYWVDEANACG